MEVEPGGAAVFDDYLVGRTPSPPGQRLPAPNAEGRVRPLDIDGDRRRLRRGVDELTGRRAADDVPDPGQRGVDLHELAARMQIAAHAVRPTPTAWLTREARSVSARVYVSSRSAPSRSGRKRSPISLRASAAIRRPSSGLSSRNAIALPSSSGLAAGTSRPVPPGCITSGTAFTEVATTGTPHITASTIAQGSPSYRLAMANTSKAGKSWPTSLRCPSR